MSHALCHATTSQLLIHLVVLVYFFVFEPRKLVKVSNFDFFNSNNVYYCSYFCLEHKLYHRLGVLCYFIPWRSGTGLIIINMFVIIIMLVITAIVYCIINISTNYLKFLIFIYSFIIKPLNDICNCIILRNIFKLFSDILY